MSSALSTLTFMTIEIDPQETPVQFIGRCAVALAEREATYGYSGDGPTAVELAAFHKVCEATWAEPDTITWKQILKIYQYQSAIVDQWAWRENDPIAMALYPVIQEVHYRIRLLLDEHFPETADKRATVESLRIVVYRAHQAAVLQKTRKEARRKFWRQLLRRASLFIMVSAYSIAFAKAKAHAPLPDSVIKAKTVYLDNQGSTSNFDKAYAEFQKWSKFTIVTTKDSADLTVVLTTGNELVDGTTQDNTTMKVFPKGAEQPAFQVTNSWAKKCVLAFKKRLEDN